MLKVSVSEAEIEGSLSIILAEFTVITEAMIDVLRRNSGTAVVAEALVTNAFIMGLQNAGKAAVATKEAPDA